MRNWFIYEALSSVRVAGLVIICRNVCITMHRKEFCYRSPCAGSLLEQKGEDKNPNTVMLEIAVSLTHYFRSIQGFESLRFLDPLDSTSTYSAWEKYSSRISTTTVPQIWELSRKSDPRPTKMIRKIHLPGCFTVCRHANINANDVNH